MQDTKQLPITFANRRKMHFLMMPGEYDATIEKISIFDNKTVGVTFRIENAGIFSGRLIYEQFTIDSPIGERIFCAFLDVLKIEHSTGNVDISRCKGKKLCVTVERTKTKEGNICVTVVGHRTDRPAPKEDKKGSKITEISTPNAG